MAEAKQPVAIRIVRPYDSAEAFTEHEGDTIGKTSIVLLGAKERPTGVILRFEITINTGEAMMRGEGRVLAFKQQALGDETGLVLRYTRLDPKSKALVDRLAAVREGQMSVPPAAAEAPTSNPQSVEVTSSDPLPQTPSTPDVTTDAPSAPASTPEAEGQDDAGTDPPPPNTDTPDVTTDAPEAGGPADEADEQDSLDAAPATQDSMPPTSAAEDATDEEEGPATDPPPSEEVDLEVSVSEPPPSISIEVELVDDDAATDEAYEAAETEAALAREAEAEATPEPSADATAAALTPTSAPPAALGQNDDPVPSSEPPDVASATPEPLATTPSIEAPASLNELPDEVPTRSREVSEVTREALLEKLRRRGERLGPEGMERVIASSPNRAG